MTPDTWIALAALLFAVVGAMLEGWRRLGNRVDAATDKLRDELDTSQDRLRTERAIMYDKLRDETRDRTQDLRTDMTTIAVRMDTRLEAKADKADMTARMDRYEASVDRLETAQSAANVTLGRVCASLEHIRDVITPNRARLQLPDSNCL